MGLPRKLDVLDGHKDFSSLISVESISVFFWKRVNTKMDLPRKDLQYIKVLEQGG